MMDRRDFLKMISNAICCSMVIPTFLKRVLPCDLSYCREDQDSQHVTECLFSTSDVYLDRRSITHVDQRPTDAGIGYVITTIKDLINYSWIAVDPGDVTDILAPHKTGRLTVGIASGPAKGRNAALMSLQRLEAQGVSISEAAGVLMCINAAAGIAMTDLNEAFEIVRAAVAKNINVVLGLVMDDACNSSFKVNLITVYG